MTCKLVPSIVLNMSTLVFILCFHRQASITFRDATLLSSVLEVKAFIDVWSTTEFTFLSTRFALVTKLQMVIIHFRRFRHVSLQAGWCWMMSLRTSSFLGPQLQIWKQILKIWKEKLGEKAAVDSVFWCKNLQQYDLV